MSTTSDDSQISEVTAYERQWKERVDSDLSELKATSRAQENTLKSIELRNESIDQKLDKISSGPNLSAWAGWGTLFAGIVWLLISSEVQTVSLTTDSADAALSSRIESLEEVAKNAIIRQDERTTRIAYLEKDIEYLLKDQEKILETLDRIQNKRESDNQKIRDRIEDLIDEN